MIFDRIKRAFQGETKETRSISSTEWIPYSFSNNFPPSSSVKLSAVGRCLRLYSDFLLQIPLETKDGGDHYLIDLLKKPNLFDTKKTFMEKLVYQVMLNGNFHAKINYNERGQITALLPYTPAALYAYPNSGEYNDPITLNQGYFYRDFKGRIFMPDEIFHIKDMMFSGFDQLNGLSRIYVYQSIFEAGGGIENVVCSLGRSGLRPPFLLTSTIPDISKEQMKAVREIVEKFLKHERAASAGVLTLPSGFDAKPLMVQNPDRTLEFLSNKSSLDIARIFGVPTELVGRPAKEGGQSAQQAKEANRFFIRTSLKAFLKGVSDSLDTLAMDGTEFEFKVDKFLASDRREESQYISQLVQSGVLSKEDAKDMLMK